jgi:predicted Zn finger-like uncharacterized protein
MTLTTRCPSCSTVFKVAQDQLQLAEGWVRCGRCDEAFEAQDALAQLRAEHEAMAAQAARGLAPPDGLQADWLPGSKWADKSRPAAAPNPWVTAAWAVAGSVSLASLLVQVALTWHDELAHTAPILRPVLEVACVLAECRIEPARRIEALTIESSQLTQLGGTVYQFSLTVRNRAAVDRTGRRSRRPKGTAMGGLRSSHAVHPGAEGPEPAGPPQHRHHGRDRLYDRVVLPLKPASPRPQHLYPETPCPP